MWLPKDERRLLAGYYKLIGEIDRERVYPESKLTPLLAFRQRLELVREYGKSAPDETGVNMENMPAFKRAVKRARAEIARVELANTMLVARKLITIRSHENEHGVILIALTLEGFDLGRRYSNWLESTGLWFERYQTHWLWLLAAAQS